MKNSLLIYFIIILLLFTYNASATDYYVKETGNDALSGTSDSNAWKNISMVNSVNFANDDSISFKRGDTFDDTTLTLNAVSAGRSGITIKDYGTGAKPRIDGNVIQPIYIDQALVNLTVKNINISGWNQGTLFANRDRAVFSTTNGITIDSVDFEGHDGVNTFAGLLTISGNCTVPYPPAGWVHMVLDIRNNDYGDITITNCSIRNVMLSAGFQASKDAWCKSDLKAIRITATDPFYTGKFDGVVYINNNTFLNIYSDHIQINGVQVPQYIHHNDCSGFGENFLDSKSSRYTYIYNNSITSGNIGKHPGVGPYGPGVTVFHLANSTSTLPNTDHEIYYNHIYTIDSTGIYASGSGTFKIHHNYFKDCLLSVYVTSPNCQIYDNVIEITSNVSQDEDGLFIGTLRSGILLTSYSFNVLAYDNTIYISNDIIDYGISVYNINTGFTANRIKNNIIRISRNNASSFPLYWDGIGTDPLTGYNILYNPNHSNRVSWDSTEYNNTEESNWISAGHTGAMFIDPVLIDPENGDLSLSSSSYAISNATNLGSPYNMALDSASTWPDNIKLLDQNSYSDWDIGAYVFTSAFVPNSSLIYQNITQTWSQGSYTFNYEQPTVNSTVITGLEFLGS